MKTILKNNRIAGVYAIPSEQILQDGSFLDKVERVLAGGVSIIQYRAKSIPVEIQLQQCEALHNLCSGFSALFIINDNIELAQKTGADGIHLGADDDDIAAARETLGSDIIIGASCYNSVEKAEIAYNKGASYVAFGRFFPSNTKPDAPQASLQTIVECKRKIDIPVVAIGGINDKNAKGVIDSGADSVAVIDYLFSADSPKEAAESLVNLFI